MYTQLPLPTALLECFTHLPERCTFPEYSGCYAVNNPEPKKERMPVYVVTWTCPDTGRFWRRHFPQTKHMKDWKGERNLWRCLKNLEVMGVTHHIQAIDRKDFNWR